MQDPREALRTWRKERNLTQEEAARMLDLSYSCYRAIEYGHRRASLRTALRVERGTKGMVPASWWESR